MRPRSCPGNINWAKVRCAKMNKTSIEQNQINQIVQIPANGIKLEGALAIAAEAQGIVLFAHGSGSSRHSPRNNFVAQVLQSAGLGTLLMDLLTPREDATYETRFDIDLLTRRLERATQWLREQPQTRLLKVGYFGASVPAQLRRCRPRRPSVHLLAPWCHAAVVQTWRCRRWSASNPRLCSSLAASVRLSSTSIGKLMANSKLKNIWPLSRARLICLRSRVPCKRWRVWQRIGSSGISVQPRLRTRHRPRFGAELLRFLVDRDPAEAKETGDCFRLSGAPC